MSAYYDSNGNGWEVSVVRGEYAWSLVDPAPIDDDDAPVYTQELALAVLTEDDRTEGELAAENASAEAPDIFESLPVLAMSAGSIKMAA